MERKSAGEAGGVEAGAAGRMKAIEHGGPLPWVQLRNAQFHPSIYRKMIGRMDARVRNGDLVTVYDRDGQMFGTGMISRHSQIGLRMLTFDASAVDEGILERRIEKAAALRRETLGLDAVTDAYRLVHAEGDGLPGLIVDRFADFAVAELFNFPMHRRMGAIGEAVKRVAGVKEVLFRSDARVQESEGFAMEADAPGGAQVKRSADRRSTIIRENGLRFQIDLTHGHKTGFFCDQRENRLGLTAFTAGKQVLDVCSYSGGFGVYAAGMGKAAGVRCVDLDEDAVALAERNANLNKIPRGGLEAIHADAFPYLRQLHGKGETADVIVLDPPKFIASREDEFEGRGKYFDLNRFAMGILKAEGLLVTCSCSGLLSLEEFGNVLRGAARSARRRVQILRTSGPGADHPVMTDCPESGYLKCFWCRVW